MVCKRKRTEKKRKEKEREEKRGVAKRRKGDIEARRPKEELLRSLLFDSTTWLLCSLTQYLYIRIYIITEKERRKLKRKKEVSPSQIL